MDRTSLEDFTRSCRFVAQRSQLALAACKRADSAALRIALDGMTALHVHAMLGDKV